MNTSSAALLWFEVLSVKMILLSAEEQQRVKVEWGEKKEEMCVHLRRFFDGVKCSYSKI